MKKALLKDSVKEIKNTYKRFISILLMAFLGVGFFAGLRATSPDMLRTIDNYYGFDFNRFWGKGLCKTNNSKSIVVEKYVSHYVYMTKETYKNLYNKDFESIGITLGLVGGYFLNYYLMGTCEIKMLRFSKTIKPISYVYASLITIVFTLIVNVAT